MTTVSISLDFSTMLDTVGSLVEGFWPIFLVPLGFALAFAILGFIYDKLVNSMKAI